MDNKPPSNPTAPTAPYASPYASPYPPLIPPPVYPHVPQIPPPPYPIDKIPIHKQEAYVLIRKTSHPDSDGLNFKVIAVYKKYEDALPQLDECTQIIGPVVMYEEKTNIPNLYPTLYPPPIKPIYYQKK
jgi:hypothetical protein